jgi:2-polyprenyl-3-methyl-5-hydroxy-6-metoxy-1,4-benzoquinol methylase
MSMLRNVRNGLQAARESLRQIAGLSPRPSTTPEGWDSEYQEGRWLYLRSDEELPRYALLAGVLRQRCQGGALLDLGCGEGILCGELWPGSYRRYLGVDISKEAIARAKLAHHPAATYVCDDLEQFAPPPGQQFDAILFNEVLYYFADPAAVVARYRQWLAPEGIVVASIYAPSLKSIQGAVARVDAEAAWMWEYVVSTRPSDRAWIIKIWSFAANPSTSSTAAD